MRAPRLVLPLMMSAVVATACSSTSGGGQHETQEPRQRAAAPAPPDLRAKYAAGRSQPVADPYYPERGNPAIDVLHYDLALTWSPAKKTLTGTATLAIRAAKDTDTVRLDFGRALRVDGVTVDGKPATERRRGDRLTVPIGRRLAKDATATVVVRYHGRPRETKFAAQRADTTRLGFATHKDGSAVALQEPYGAFTWYPSNDQPSDKALYDIAITVPKGWSGVSSGTYQGKAARGDTAVYRWRASNPMATYLVTFVADRLTMVRQQGPHGLPLTYWFRPKDRAKNLTTLRKTPRFLAWLEARLGRYPFPSGGAVIAGDSGMETQQMITIASGLPDAVLVHEYAHQWFGNTVTPRTWTDVWLNEGFAMYFEIMYSVERLGGRLDEYMKGVRTFDGELRSKYGPPGRYKKAAFASPNVYYCPAMMLHEIRERVGDKKFFAMARGWVAEHKDTNQDRKAFIAWVNKSTGKDLRPLINRWLDAKTTPA